MISYYKDIIGSRVKVAAILPDGSYIECYTSGGYTFFAGGVEPNVSYNIQHGWIPTDDTEFKAVCEQATTSICNLLDNCATQDDK